MGNCGSTDANVSIHELARSGDVNGVRNILKDKSVDPNGRDKRTEPFNTPLIDAVVNQNLEVARVLLADNRVDPNLRNEDGNTALHLAVQGKLVLNYEIAVLLVEDSRVSIHIRDTHNKKPFDYLESSANREKFEKYLGEKNIDIEAGTPKADQVKIEASFHAPAPEAPVQHDLKAETHDVGALHDAAKKGDVNAVRNLLKSDSIDINGHDSRATPGNTALIDATANQNLEIVRLLVSDDRLDPNTANEDGNTALHLAVQGKFVLDLEIAELLLADKRIDVTVKDKHGKTALELVKGSANEAKLEAFLIEKGFIQAVVQAVEEVVAAVTEAVQEEAAAVQEEVAAAQE